MVIGIQQFKNPFGLRYPVDMRRIKGQEWLRWRGGAAQIQAQVTLQAAPGFSDRLLITVTLCDLLKSSDAGGGIECRRFFPAVGQRRPSIRP
jgi:hypothetical protein